MSANMEVSTESTSHSDIFIGRQPIFDRDLNLFAYELLYRNSEENSATVTDQSQSTSEVIINLVTNFGFDVVTGGHTAFINLSKDFLTGKKPLPLPHDKVVLEVLEDIIVDQELIDGLKKLSSENYTIALDDFVYSEEWEPVLPLVDYIKVEIPLLSNDEIKSHVAQLKKYGVKLLAEKVETEAEYDFLHECGFDYFQGYFLARPKVLSGKTIPPNKLTMILLLSDLNNTAIEIDKLTETISNDVSLCYKILRYINSAHYALPRNVSSIREAITYVGMNELRRWASLITMSNLSAQSTQASEMMQQTIIRANMCEQIAEHRGVSDTQVYFSVGLLSTLDALLGLPMEEILTTLPLSDEMLEALVSYDGDVGKVLKCAVAYENADWEEANRIDLSATQLRDCFFNALSRSNNSLSMFT